jgi:hypothetical protein
MTVNLDLSPEQEQRLRENARTRGVAADELLRQVVADALARFDAAAPTPRVAGLHAGHTHIGDDFDAPLPDSFWTGAE